MEGFTHNYNGGVDFIQYSSTPSLLSNTSLLEFAKSLLPQHIRIELNVDENKNPSDYNHWKDQELYRV